jgi:hypothetical protein
VIQVQSLEIKVPALGIFFPALAIEGNSPAIQVSTLEISLP